MTDVSDRPAVLVPIVKAAGLRDLNARLRGEPPHLKATKEWAAFLRLKDEHPEAREIPLSDSTLKAAIALAWSE